MFTGIITGLGQIAAVHPLGSSACHGKRLSVLTPPGYLHDVAPGDSIALNGACMTVTTLDAAAARFTLEVSAESLEKTSGLDQQGAAVNLEKAVRASDRLGGHIVSGHIDGVGVVSHFAPQGESHELRVLAPLGLAKYLACKGSVAINGVSLTINRVTDQANGCEISINLIAHTLAHTTLGALQPGSRVNLEIDTVARYCERMLTR